MQFYLPTTPIERLTQPFAKFSKREASSGLVLMFVTVLALAIANSPLGEQYFGAINTYLKFSVGGAEAKISVVHFVNDVLMAIFFLMVGLEIKRELITGELSNLKAATLPIAAAIGGMIVPAGIYAAINWGKPSIAGWAIPMATDIAFALGILSLLSSRVPVSVRVFLAALAIVDDIGAVIVIGLFFTKSLSLPMLGGAAAVFALMLGLNSLGARKLGVYWLCFGALWVFIFLSGIHATIAGVLAALAIPATSRINAEKFTAEARQLVETVHSAGDNDDDAILNEEQDTSVRNLEKLCEHVATPLQRLEHGLHPWVAFAIMPIFAFCNAGVSLGGGAAMGPISTGIAAGLFLGKPLGIMLFVWVAIKLKIATLPEGVNLSQIFGAALLAGVGFTMALFISGLSMPNQMKLDESKIAILFASILAGLAGFMWLYFSSKPQAVQEAN